jgi:hypothetical protein
MTEAELQNEITTLAESLGLVVLHVREPRREGGQWAGYPDLVCYGPQAPYVLYRELKATTGLSGVQKRWQWRLRDWCHQDYGTWRAADWLSGRIPQELAALAGQDAIVSDQPDPATTFFAALYGRNRRAR